MASNITMTVKITPAGHFESTHFLARVGDEVSEPEPVRVIPLETSQIAPGHAVVLDVSGFQLPGAALDPGLSAD